VVVGLLGNENPDSNRFTLVTPKSENDVRLQATLGNQNPKGLPVGAVSERIMDVGEIEVHVNIPLSQEELQKAHEEYIKSFMEGELINTFNLEPDKARQLAEVSFERYARGDGLTEYECIEAALEEYHEEEMDR